MEFRQLKYFLTVAETGQITRAAERLNITQPPLSQQIILLEEELGVQLLERSKKQIRLTEAGKILRNRAEQVAELMQVAVDEVQEAAAGIRGKLMIGTITSSGRSLIPGYIQKYHKLYPFVTFDLRQGDSRRVLELLDAGLIEIGLVRLPIDETMYDSIVLPKENMVVVSLPSEETMAGKTTEAEMDLSELRDTPLLIHRRYEAIVAESCRNILCISDDVTPLLIWARFGLGTAIVPEAAVHLLQGSPLAITKISIPGLLTTSAVIWRKKHSLSPIAARFIELFQRYRTE